MIQKLDRITRIDYNGIWNRVFSYIFTSVCFSCIQRIILLPGMSVWV